MFTIQFVNSFFPSQRDAIIPSSPSSEIPPSCGAFPPASGAFSLASGAFLPTCRVFLPGRQNVLSYRKYTKNNSNRQFHSSKKKFHSYDLGVSLVGMKLLELTFYTAFKGKKVKK